MSSNTADVLEFARAHVAQGEAVAWVTVTETYGSSPASAGQVMAVLADGASAGTVGGGATEYRLIQEAVRAIASGAQVFAFDYDHAENGMVCGGGMRGFGNLLGNAARLVVFGGGHIAQCLAPLAAATGFSVTVVEDRAELASAFPSARFVLCAQTEYAARIPIAQSDFVVICTRGHAHDADALRYCVAQAPRYCGMIGSKRKVATLFAQLRDELVSHEALRRVYAPIGLQIASSKPAEIAVAILAEVLLVKNDGSPAHMRDLAHE